MNIEISEHFNLSKLIRFVLPSVGMMIFTSIYTLVDGYFVSNYTGNIPFAAVNLILPFLMIFSAVGFMIGTGGTALVALKLGMGDVKKANGIFSMLIYTIIAFGILVAVLGEIWLEDVAVLLGATEEMLPYCVEYGRVYILAIGAFMLQTSFQSFLVAAGKPRLGFIITVLSGLTNMVLDYLLVAVIPRGVTGAAIATSLSMVVGGIVPLVFFMLPNSSTLRLGRPDRNIRYLLKTCGNGSSEFLSNIAMNVVAMLYNLQLLKYIGESGVTAYGVIMYVCFIFAAVFIGLDMGAAPLVSYHYGAGNSDEVKNLYRLCMKITAVLSFAMFVCAELCATPLSGLYVGYDDALMDLTKHAFKIYSFSFLLMGFNMFGSAFFTALNDGRVSAAISFLRTLVFQVAAVELMPLLFEVDGVWLATTAAEGMALAVTAYFLISGKKKYSY